MFVPCDLEEKDLDNTFDMWLLSQEWQKVQEEMDIHSIEQLPLMLRVAEKVEIEQERLQMALQDPVRKIGLFHPEIVKAFTPVVKNLQPRLKLGKGLIYNYMINSILA